jgi:hypothetical protein
MIFVPSFRPYPVSCLCTALLVILVLYSCQPQPQPQLAAGSPIQWRSLVDGKIEASQRNMPVLVDFFLGPECMRCVAVQKDIYDDRELAARIERDFIPVRVWLSRELSADEQALSAQLHNGDECILAFLDAHGQVVKNSQGEDISSMQMLPADEYLRYMDEALKNLD